MFPARHRGTVTRRTWYKVREKAGGIRLLSEEQYEHERGRVVVLDTVETDRCTTGPPLSGWTEQRIDAWITEHRK